MCTKGVLTEEEMRSFLGGVARSQSVSHSAVLDFKQQRSAAVHHDDSERSDCAANKPAKISGNVRPPASWNDLTPGEETPFVWRHVNPWKGSRSPAAFFIFFLA